MSETLSGYPIQQILVEDITSHPENPYDHPQAQLDAIRQSYQELGDLQPFVWNQRTGRLVDGHARLEVLKQAGRKAVNCIVVDWDEAQEAKALLTINRTGAMATLNDENLLSLLSRFDVEEDALLSLMWDEASVAQMLATVAPVADIGATLSGTSARAKDDPNGGGDAFLEGLPALPPTRTQPGEVWQLGRHRLYVGDCAHTTAYARLQVPPIDLLFTDPPYNIEAQSGDSELSSRPLWKELRQAELDGFDPVPFLDTVELYLGKACNVEFFCDQSLIPLYMDWAKARKFTTDLIVWQKPNPTPLGGQRWPEIEYLVQMRRQGHFAADAPHRRKKVLSYSRESGLHPTIKPLPLVVGEMELLSAEGATVFDGYAGSGTTLIAGERLGRTVYACEKSPRWADVILARFEAETGQKAWVEER